MTKNARILALGAMAILTLCAFAESRAKDREAGQPGNQRLATTSQAWPCGWNEAPAPLGSAYVVKNSWGCDVHHEHLTFFAGYIRHSPTVGFVVAMARSFDLHRTGGHTYFEPGSGVLRIVRFSHDTLLVQTSTGKEFSIQIPSGGYALR